MNTRIQHDDGNLIWFSFNNLDIDALDNTELSTFDITDMPIYQDGRDILGYPKIYPKHFELKNYYVTFFKDSLSKTGYSCMCINRNRTIYKERRGYLNGSPASLNY